MSFATPQAASKVPWIARNRTSGRVLSCVKAAGAIIGGVVKVPYIVRNGVVVPQPNERLPQGTQVEIRLKPGGISPQLWSQH